MFVGGLLTFVLLLFDFPATCATTRRPGSPTVVDRTTVMASSRSNTILCTGGTSGGVCPTDLAGVTATVCTVRGKSLGSVTAVDGGTTRIRKAQICLRRKRGIPLVGLIRKVLVGSKGSTT